MIPREAYLAGSDWERVVAEADMDATVWIRDRSSYYSAIGFHGKANKPDFRLYFRTPESRDAYIVRYFAGQRQAMEYKQERRKAQTAPHTLKVGDILDSHWGYDQTNVDFYEVTKIISPRMVELRMIAQEQTPTLYLQGTCVPVPGKFIGPAMRKRADSNNRITLTSYSGASPWHGRPCSWSSYA